MALKTLGIGDNVADFYTHINTIYPGGCSFNFAAYSSMLGNDSAYLGIVGNDYAARHIMTTADEMGIDTSRCRILFGATPLPAVKIQDGERVFVGQNEHGAWERQLILTPKDLDYVSQFSFMHTSLYGGMEQNLEILQETGVPIAMDFGTTYSDMFIKAQCKYITYAIMSCAHITMEEMHQQIEKAHEFGASYVLATRGSEGSWFSDGIKIYHRDANLVTAVDTNGAGDSFLTAFLSSFVEWKITSEKGSNQAARENAIYAALDSASSFAGKTVLLNGAFGHGIAYKEDIVID